MSKNRIYKNRTLSQMEINRRHQDKVASIDNELNAAIAKIDWKRRKKAERSLYDWCCEYMVGLLLNTTPPPRGKEVLDEMDYATTNHTNTLLCMARGQGKTSYCQCDCLYGIATGKQKYVVIISANQKSADNLLSDFYKMVMEKDTKFAQDYPELTLPFQLLNGSTRRRQMYLGVSTDLVHNSGTLQFARLVTKSGNELPSSGSIIETRGYTGQLRGMKKLAGGKSIRPTLALLDDWEDEDSAQSPSSVQKMWDIIQKDIVPMGGDQRMALLCTATPVCDDDLVERLKKDKHWRTVLFPAVISYPKHMELWDEYFEMFNRELVDRLPHIEGSLQFYREHFEEMNEGAEVFNPNRFCVDDGHLSAIQKLLETQNAIGENAFASEYQMSPIRLQFALPITPQTVNARLSSLSELEIPQQDVRLVVASSDLNVSKYITTVIMVFMRNGSSVVIWRKFKKCSINANVPPEEYDRQLYNLLSEHGMELKNLGIRIDAWAIDGNGTAWNAVTRFANNSKTICGISAASFVGRASHQYRDYLRSRLKESVNRTLLCGDDDEQKKFGSGTRWTYFDSDLYHEKCQKGFLQSVGNLGSISWYKGADHSKFSIQVCAEKLVDKIQRADGTVEYKWKQIGTDHDVLDAIGQALAVYGSFGFSDNTIGKTSTIQRKGIKKFPRKKYVFT